MNKVSILDVCKLNDKTVNEYKGIKKYVATGGVEKDKVVSYTEVTFDEKPSRANRKVEIGDILLAKMKDTEKVLLIDEENKNYIYSTGFFTIKPNTEVVSTEYIYYVLKSKYFQNEKNKLAKGATQKALNKDGLKKIKIPVPSLKKQEVIVNVLKNVELTLSKRQQQIEALSALKQSIFLEMFGDPIQNTKKYTKKPLKEIGAITTGNTPPRKDKENYGNYIEWIKSNNICDESIYLTEASEYLSEIGASKGKIVPINSLLVTCIAGSKSSIGKVAIANRNVAFNQQINAITPFKEIDTTFLYSQLKVLQPLIQSFSTNSMKGMISKSNFEKIEVIVPLIEEQLIFSNKFNQIALTKEKLKKSFNFMEAIYDSILHKSFSGELFKEEA